MLVANATDPLVTSNGYLLYVSDGVLYATRSTLHAAHSTDDPPALPKASADRALTAPSAPFAASEAGVLAYVPGAAGSLTGDSRLAIADRAGRITPLAVPAGRYTAVRVSPDGRQLAIGSEDGNSAIVWIYDLNGHLALQRLTVVGRNRHPIWSPDGAWVAFESERDGADGIYRQRVDGSGTAERLTTAGRGETQIPESWSPDGRVISFANVATAAWTDDLHAFHALRGRTGKYLALRQRTFGRTAAICLLP